MNPPPAEGLAHRLFLGPALRAQPDRRLVKLVREGYEAAFEEIVRRYGRPLGRYAAAIVGAHAEDVTQDAFSKALLALRRDEREVELRPWLYRIVRNTALNDLRDRPPEAAELADETGSGSRSAAEEAERREEVSELMQRLRALPEPQRAAIVMRELEGLSHEEIAKALGLSGGAARQTIYRARLALRDGLGLFIPLPVVRTLIEHGPEASVAGAGAGGAAVAVGAATAGGAGAGGALKIGLATALIAGSLGAGVAIDGHVTKHGPADAAVAAEQSAPPGAGSDSTEGLSPTRAGASEESSEGSGEGSGESSGEGSGPSLDEARDEVGSAGSGEGHGDRGSGGPQAPGPEQQGLSTGHGGPGSGGRGGEGQPPTGGDRSGPGPGGGGDGGDGVHDGGQLSLESPPPTDQGTSQGPGGGSGSESGSGSSGSGSGSSGSGSSGSGSGSSGSGSGSSSGPGSGDAAASAVPEIGL